MICVFKIEKVNGTRTEIFMPQVIKLKDWKSFRSMSDIIEGLINPLQPDKKIFRMLHMHTIECPDNATDESISISIAEHLNIPVEKLGSITTRLQISPQDERSRINDTFPCLIPELT